jgi:hypothetical protein
MNAKQLMYAHLYGISRDGWNRLLTKKETAMTTDTIPANRVNRATRRSALAMQRVRCTRNPKFHAKRAGLDNHSGTHFVVNSKEWQYAAQVEALAHTALGARHV